MIVSLFNPASHFRLTLAVAMLWLYPVQALAYLELAGASVETLDNGLTVIILEDHTFPVVSVQMLYRAGARDEPLGKTGLAHFVEHMAFRQSANFPDTGLVSSIYAVGGEWHGYTWLDQTTYFATVPAAELELLLKIEADRMANLEIAAAEVESERGAVLTEMHGYENDPASVLHDYVLYLSFLAHPYRNNTIGWESDVANTRHADLLSFYERHYHAGNAVLSVVGAVDRDDVMRRVRQYFAPLQGRPSTPAPHTVEPPQIGERRIRLQGAPNRKYFEIVYRAPSVNSPDYAAFLLTQDLLAAGSGVSFLQNDWGTPARPDSVLGGISDDLSTWFPPSGQSYVFAIKGSRAAGADEKVTEAAIEAGIERLRNQFGADAGSATAALAEAMERVQRELVFDIQTTEDAAHQLAFFAGLDALNVLINLPELLRQVGIADISRVLDGYFRSEQRTIGWNAPAVQDHPVYAQPASPDAGAGPVSQSKGGDGSDRPGQPEAAAALMAQLSNGTPVIVRRSSLSPTATLKVVVPAADFQLPDGVSRGTPALGLSSLDFELLPGEMDQAVKRAREVMDSAVSIDASTNTANDDPDELLEQAYRDILGFAYENALPIGPVLLVVTGDVDPARALRSLENGFSDLPSTAWKIPQAIDPSRSKEVEKHMAYPIAQEKFAYLAVVPDPQKQAAAWQIALYIISHGYEGRLGKEAITRRGLVYYIGSAYHTDGRNHWITLSTGVDPDKLAAMKTLLREQLALLVADPPSQHEIDEARKHILGRYLSAAQSNPELAARLARQWVFHGGLLGYDELERLLNGVSGQDLIDLLPAFTQGSIVSVRNPAPAD